MTSKEALEILVSKTNLLNNTCSSLNNCIKSKKCVLNTPCENCDDYKLVMTIKQDLVRLERLEKLEKDFKKINEFNKKLREENSKYKKTIKILKDKNVQIYDLLNSSSVESYNNLSWSTYDFDGLELDKIEYELLKEVLSYE